MAAQAALDAQAGALVAVIGDEDTVTGFLLAGAGHLDLRRKGNFLIVDKSTTIKEIETAFKDFTARDDVAIVLISQYVADMIRFAVDAYNKPIPAVLEMPSKHHPYDPTKDSILSRARFMLTGETDPDTAAHGAWAACALPHGSQPQVMLVKQRFRPPPAKP
eukprot:CAMPEP_0117677084 /NCGR_PEP_ID=MMETSP0804-20121206/16553_1 /TAXON_ID=1074897 /ORGANISM="Tetraselmis astigmatica, Strain CCMP880" /LENGTH=161 /DNA_ID=CAMNT_0005486337 /DNA_START=16 /DNA_END=502 /DNA_ORIENTATION=-